MSALEMTSAHWARYMDARDAVIEAAEGLSGRTVRIAEAAFALTEAEVKFRASLGDARAEAWAKPATADLLADVQRATVRLIEACGR